MRGGRIRVGSQLVHVGDGLCHRFERTDEWAGALQVDCGSQQGGRYSADRWLKSVGFPKLWGTEAICVTHYHTDHYNGLVWASRNAAVPRLPLLSVFYHPGTPTPDSQDLLRAAFALHAFTTGSTGLPMDLDLWRQVARLSARSSVERRPLFQGDTVYAGGVRLDVVWPPRETGKGVSKSVRQALDAFYELMDTPERETLRELYDRTADATLFGEAGTETDLYDVVPDVDPVTSSGMGYEIDELATDKELAEVNRKVRDAANRLSLAFVADGRTLCLGDLEGVALGQAVCYVRDEVGLDFDVIVAPHHGTKWHKAMNVLRAQTMAVPVGGGLWRHVRPELGRIASRVRFTHIEDDLWL